MIEYIQQKTALHVLDARTKLVLFAVVVLLAMLFSHPFCNLTIALAVCLVAMVIRLPLSRTFKVLQPLLLVFLFILVITTFTGSANAKVLFYLLPGRRLAVTTRLFTGINFLLRIFIMVLASTLLTLTTPIDDFLEVFKRSGLPHEVCIILTTGLRFIPTMEKKMKSILEAQRARGAAISDKGIVGQIRSYIPIMIPMLVNAILMANQLAIAMVNRGFGVYKQWTSWNELKFRAMDYVLIISGILVAVIAVAARFYYGFGVLS